MKKTIKLMVILALGAGITFLQSCKDDEGTTTTGTPQPTGKTCYIALEQTIEDGDTTTTTYKYNSENQLISISEKMGSSTSTVTLTYAGGKLTSVLGKQKETYTLTYNGSQISRVDLVDDGDSTYDILTYTNGKVSKSERFYDEDGKAIITARTTITYSGDNVATLKTVGSDDNGVTFEDFLEIKDILYDDKKDIYNGNLAFAFSDDLIILVSSKNNVKQNTSILNFFGSITETTVYTYTYTDNGYPATETYMSDGKPVTTSYTYTCP